MKFFPTVVKLNLIFTKVADVNLTTLGREGENLLSGSVFNFGLGFQRV